APPASTMWTKTHASAGTAAAPASRVIWYSRSTGAPAPTAGAWGVTTTRAAGATGAASLWQAARARAVAVAVASRHQRDVRDVSGIRRSSSHVLGDEPFAAQVALTIGRTIHADLRGHLDERRPIELRERADRESLPER